MNYYDRIEYMHPSTRYYDEHTEQYKQLNLSRLCKASQLQAKEDRMKPIDRATMLERPLGLVAVGIVSMPRGFEMHHPLAYASVSGTTDYEGSKLAVMSSVIVRHCARGIGLGFYTVESVLEVAGSDEAIAEHGHEGYIARCNDVSKGLFVKHGFEQRTEEQGKYIMVREL